MLESVAFISHLSIKKEKMQRNRLSWAPRQRYTFLIPFRSGDEVREGDPQLALVTP